MNVSSCAEGSEKKFRTKFQMVVLTLLNVQILYLLLTIKECFV